MTPSSFLHEQEMLARQESERANRNVEDVRQQLERAIRASRFWEDLSHALRGSHAAQALLILRRESEFLREFSGPEAQVVERLRELYSHLHQVARESAASIDREFPTATRAAGIQIDRTSRHPTYTFNQGFLRAVLSERDLTAKISPRDGNELIVGLDLDLVVETIRSELARLFERDVDGESLLRSLHTAYAAVLRSEDRDDGDELPLRRVTSRLAKNLNRFAADEFNVDLSNLVQRGELLIDGKRLHLNHTRDRRQGMLLYGLESGGYVGFISFKKDKNV